MDGGLLFALAPAPDGPTGIVVWLAATATALTALEVIRRKALAPLWHFYKWLRHEVRGEVDRRKKIDAIIERELTHNGGKSMKDASTNIVDALASVRDDVADLKGSQETTFELLDAVVERKGKEHSEIWDALARLGFDRRRPEGTT